MRDVARPNVRLISKPSVDWDEIGAYLEEVGGIDWRNRLFEQGLAAEERDAEALIEFGGRLCYRSWVPGLNANVTKVREDSDDYLANIIKQLHGSVLEHANFSFVLQDVSRVFTHELVRHRPGVAISQESMRYVRLTDIPFWFPDWAREDDELMDHMHAVITMLEEFQSWAADHFGLNDESVPFSEKKHKTSFMRRLAPDGVATSMLWSANVRTLRWLIENRTAPAAEEEIRLVFDQIAGIMVGECPALFDDFTRDPDGTWTPMHRKV